MLIETDPCQYCDFTPAVCDGDIELCMMLREQSRPISNEEYEKRKLERYLRNESKSFKSELRRCTGNDGERSD